MERLWSPWRMAYLTNEEKPEGCVFCRKLAEQNDAQNLLVHRGRHAAIIMNLYPYNTGHLMVIPYSHASSTEELDRDTLTEMMELVNLGMRILRRTLRPDGFNVGINIGRSAGAGIAEHVHIHIVPRWSGDSNFLTILGQTRVIPEFLEDTYCRLVAALKEELGSTPSEAS
ncbi:MAG: HIT family protein [Anaerolineae bacterium]